MLSLSWENLRKISANIQGLAELTWISKIIFTTNWNFSIIKMSGIILDSKNESSWSSGEVFEILWFFHSIPVEFLLIVRFFVCLKNKWNAIFRNFDDRLNKAISAKEEHSRNYDRMLSDQTKNYTAEIRSIASLAGNLKNYESKFTAADLRFQQMADKMAALQDWI